jgi:nitric oxide reductase subunit B
LAHYQSQFSIRRLWIIFAVSMAVMFGVLLYFGGQIYQAAPPMPLRVQSASGETIFTREQIERGQNLWQSMGGMEQGSIWGHGSYVAPDWSADWLHREALASLEGLARSQGVTPFEKLSEPDQARLQAMLRQDMRANTYDPNSKIITVSDARANSIATVSEHFSDLLQASTSQARALRVQYAFPVDASLSADEAHAVNAFYFWTAWATTTNRPGQTITYTSNWPYEPLVGNTPTCARFSCGRSFRSLCCLRRHRRAGLVLCQRI